MNEFAKTMNGKKFLNDISRIAKALERIADNLEVDDEEIKPIDPDLGYCTSCGKYFSERPALSRLDDKTEICPDCGMKEALEIAKEFIEQPR